MASEHAKQHRAHGGQGAEQALRVPGLGLHPQVTGQQRAVQPGAGVAPGLQQPGGHHAVRPRYRHSQHQHGIDREEPDQRLHLPAPAAPQHQGRGQQRAQGDALQHAGDAHGPPVEVRDQVEREAHQKDHERPPRQAAQQGRAAVAQGQAPARGQRHGHADDEEEEGKDPVSEGPAVPGCVGELRIQVRPVTRVVDQHHARDGKAAKGVQRGQTLFGSGWWRGSGHGLALEAGVGETGAVPAAACDGAAALASASSCLRPNSGGIFSMAATATEGRVATHTQTKNVV